MQLRVMFHTSIKVACLKNAFSLTLKNAVGFLRVTGFFCKILRKVRLSPPQNFNKANYSVNINDINQAIRRGDRYAIFISYIEASPF